MSEGNGASTCKAGGRVGWLGQTETKLKGFASPTVPGDAQVSGITGCLGSQHHGPVLEVGCGMYCGIELLDWEALAVVRVTSTPPTRWALVSKRADWARITEGGVGTAGSTGSACVGG